MQTAGQADFEIEIAAFTAQLAGLQQRVGSAWVVFAGDRCEGSFPDFDAAARFAETRFRQKPVLIRHTDEKPAYVPFLIVEV